MNEPQFSRLARNEKIDQTAIQTKKDAAVVGVTVAGDGGVWDEPTTPYAAVYPYNRVMETESGHILEFDDTPGAERVHIFHRSGTFDEIGPDGTKVIHVKSDAFEIVLSDKKVYVKGSLDITADQDINIKAGQNLTIEAGLEIKVIAGAGITTLAGADQTHTAAGAMTMIGIPMNWNP